MIRKYLCSLFVFVIGNSLQAQTINFADNSAFVTFSSDASDIYLDFVPNVTVSNSQNVVLRGEIYSDEFVVIKPFDTYSIVMKPILPCPTCNVPFNVNADPPGTVIKPKPGGSGKIETPAVVVYPVPVHNDLTFNVSNYMVVAFAIFDINGIAKISQNLNPTNNYTIDVSGLTVGNYILKLNLGNNLCTTIQFIKN
jgi:hypothetical protein